MRNDLRGAVGNMETCSTSIWCFFGDFWFFFWATPPHTCTVKPSAHAVGVHPTHKLGHMGIRGKTSAETAELWLEFQLFCAISVLFMQGLPPKIVPVNCWQRHPDNLPFFTNSNAQFEKHFQKTTEKVVNLGIFTDGVAVASPNKGRQNYNSLINVLHWIKW